MLEQFNVSSNPVSTETSNIGRCCCTLANRGHSLVSNTSLC